jgi:hypothetical protein
MAALLFFIYHPDIGHHVNEKFPRKEPGFAGPIRIPRPESSYPDSPMPLFETGRRVGFLPRPGFISP